MTSKAKYQLLAHTILLLGMAQALFPFLWMIVVSLMTYTESVSTSFSLPKTFQWVNYVTVAATLELPRLFLNSALMSGGVIAAQLAFCSLAGYAFARIDFPGKRVIFLVLMSILMVPSSVFLLPQYLVMVNLKLVDSITGLILPGAFSIFGTFLMRQGFLQIDKSIEESALIEGCGYFRSYWHVMLPLTRPSMLTLALLDGIWAWNNLVWPLILNNSPDKMTLASQLAMFSSQYTIDFPSLMAAASMAVAPIVVIYFLMQKKFIQSVAVFAGK